MVLFVGFGSKARLLSEIVCFLPGFNSIEVVYFLSCFNSVIVDLSPVHQVFDLVFRCDICIPFVFKDTAICWPL